ncbi:MAG: phosphate ABC transporter permease subunit PstC [Chitinophagales bacterium]|nr:phosphate ABC transporter permease subunit PstC [Chitinophagales bacterium]
MVTSIVILLIVVFLFKEGMGLFSSPIVESGYGLYLNTTNPVSDLSFTQIKQIYDGEIDNWKTVGGKDEVIELFRFDDIFSIYSDEELGENYEFLPEKLNQVITDKSNIIAFLPYKYAPKQSSFVKEISKENIGIREFLLGKEWLPTTTPSPLFGIVPLILGTLLVSFFAILFALPLGLGVAIYISEIASSKIRRIIKPAIELLAGIPSVVYGFFGLTVLVPIVQKVGNLTVGETAFTGSLILAIMALPTIISISEDALRNTPLSLREASYALGATQWQTIYKVVIPFAGSGISTAAILGIGRAIGETMAVLMVTGNGAVIPHSLFESVRTIPATIAAELGEAPSGGAHYQALFLLGCVLFLITLCFSIISEYISKKQSSKIA